MFYSLIRLYELSIKKNRAVMLKRDENYGVSDGIYAN